MARDTLRHGAGSLVVKVIRVVQEILVASLLAIQGSMDGWLAAYALASVPVNLLLHAYQPPLVARLCSSRLASFDLRSVVVHVVLAGACGGVLVLGIGPAWFMHALTSPTARVAADRILPVLAFYTLAGSVNIALNGALQARGRFFAAGVLPVAAPLAIGALLLWSPSSGVQALAWGLALGSLIETMLSMLILGLAAQRPAARRGESDAGGAPVVSGAIALLPGVICAAIVPLAEQYYASRAGGEGGVAVLGYAQRLPFFLAGTLSLSIGAVGTTTLARLSSRGGSAIRVLNRTGLWIIGASTLLVLPLSMASRPITALIFERGAFVRDATAAVAPVTALLLAGLPFMLLRLLALRSLTVAGRNGLASAVQALGLVLVVLLNSLLEGAGMGIRGVAAISSLTMALTASIAWFQATRRVT